MEKKKERKTTKDIQFFDDVATLIYKVTLLTE